MIPHLGKGKHPMIRWGKASHPGGWAVAKLPFKTVARLSCCGWAVAGPHRAAVRIKQGDACVALST